MTTWLYNPKTEASWGRKEVLKEFLSADELNAQAGASYGIHADAGPNGVIPNSKGPLSRLVRGSKRQSFKVGYRAGAGDPITVNLLYSFDKGVTWFQRPNLTGAVINPGEMFEHNVADDTVDYVAIEIELGATVPANGLDVEILTNMVD